MLDAGAVSDMGVTLKITTPDDIFKSPQPHNS